jgi:O-antigen/teichoic acid export membrane protein
LILGPTFISLLLGDNYSDGSYLLTGLSAYALGVVWFENLKVLAMSRNSHKAMLLGRVLQIVISIVLIYPLIQLARLTGAGISAGISALGMAILGTYMVSRYKLHGPSGGWVAYKPIAVYRKQSNRLTTN